MLNKDVFTTITFLIVLFIYSLIFSVQSYNYKKEIIELKQQIEAFEQKQSIIDEVTWLQAAYVKCKNGANENQIRDCVAFEIKELRH